MNRRTLCNACFAVLMAATSATVLAKGGTLAGASPTAGLGPSGLPGTSAPANATPGGARATAVLDGANVGRAEKTSMAVHTGGGGYSRASALPAMTGVIWGLNGEIKAAGGLNDEPVTTRMAGLVGQSRVDGSLKGVGNSHVAEAQQGIGNSQGALVQDLAAARGVAAATPTNVMNHLSEMNSAAQGTGGLASPTVKTDPKTCSGGSGKSCH